jgi:mono/diheme cytochrome c family protein
MRTLAVIIAGLCGFCAWADDSAADVWTARCKGCHGPDGKAHTKIGEKVKIEDMTSPKWQAETSDAEIKKIISDGSPKKGSKMKPFKEKLTPGELDSLIPYIRQLKGK